MSADKIGTTEGARITGEHPSTLLMAAKRGEIKADFTDTGRAIFERQDLEKRAVDKLATNGRRRRS